MYLNLLGVQLQLLHLINTSLIQMYISNMYLAIGCYCPLIIKQRLLLHTLQHIMCDTIVCLQLLFLIFPIQDQQKELRNREELSSLVWICTSTHSATKVIIVDANQPGNILDSFIVCNSHVLCIASVPGKRHSVTNVLS